MATHTFVNLDLPEANTLADLTSVEFDLLSAKDFALRLKGMFSANPPDYSLVDPLSTAIIIRYSRTFASGVRKLPLEEGLLQLTKNQKEKHQYFRDLRDKHIAHSVNCFEESTPRANYCKERVKAEGITSISCEHNRVVGLSSENLDAVVELADTWLEFVGMKTKEESTRLLPIVREMPLDDVLSVGMKPTDSGRGPVDKRRK